MKTSEIKKQLKVLGVVCLCKQNYDMIRIYTVSFESEFSDEQQKIILNFLKSNGAVGVKYTDINVNQNGSEFFFPKLSEPMTRQQYVNKFNK